MFLSFWFSSVSKFFCFEVQSNSVGYRIGLRGVFYCTQWYGISQGLRYPVRGCSVSCRTFWAGCSTYEHVVQKSEQVVHVEMWYIPTEGIVTAYYLLHASSRTSNHNLSYRTNRNDCHLCWPSWPRCRECPFIQYVGGILCTETALTLLKSRVQKKLNSKQVVLRNKYKIVQKRAKSVQIAARQQQQPDSSNQIAAARHYQSSIVKGTINPLTDYLQYPPTRSCKNGGNLPPLHYVSY